MDMNAFRERHAAWSKRVERGTSLIWGLLVLLLILDETVHLPSRVWSVALPLMSGVLLAAAVTDSLVATSRTVRILSAVVAVLLAMLFVFVMATTFFGWPETVTRAMVAITEWHTH
jgi:hypothetical protein